MSDNDLIRRGDALNAIKPIYGWSITAAEEVWGAIAALPAVTVVPAVRVKPQTEYERKVAQMREDFPNGI